MGRTGIGLPAPESAHVDAVVSEGQRSAVVKVVQRGRISVYVYLESGNRHHLPHCHVYWPDGGCVTGLADARLLVGQEPPSDAWRLVREHLDELREAWERLNTRRSP